MLTQTDYSKIIIIIYMQRTFTPGIEKYNKCLIKLFVYCWFSSSHWYYDKHIVFSNRCIGGNTERISHGIVIIIINNLQKIKLMLKQQLVSKASKENTVTALMHGACILHANWKHNYMRILLYMYILMVTVQCLS